MTSQNLLFPFFFISPVKGISFSTSISFQSPFCNTIKMFHAGQIISDNWLAYGDLYLKCDLTNWLSPKCRAVWLSMYRFKIISCTMGIPVFFELLLTGYSKAYFLSGFWILSLDDCSIAYYATCSTKHYISKRFSSCQPALSSVLVSEPKSLGHIAI